MKSILVRVGAGIFCELHGPAQRPRAFLRPEKEVKDERGTLCRGYDATSGKLQSEKKVGSVMRNYSFLFASI